jgi:hypothetical protein
VNNSGQCVNTKAQIIIYLYLVALLSQVFSYIHTRSQIRPHNHREITITNTFLHPFGVRLFALNQSQFKYRTGRKSSKMKVFTLFLIGVLIHLSESSFVWFDSSKPSNPKPKEYAATGSRFIVNIVEYQFINNTHEKSANKFRCIGTLVSENHVVTTANCVTVPIGTHIGVQFETIREDTNEIGCEYGGQEKMCFNNFIINSRLTDV